MQAPNGDVYVSGLFSSVSGQHAGGIARWNGATWFSMGSGVRRISTAVPVAGHLLALSDDSVYLSGGFDFIDDVPATNIARWNGTAWTALGDGVDGGVGPMIRLPSGNILAAAGRGSRSGQTYIGSLGEWDGSAWHPWLPLVDGNIAAMIRLPNNNIVIAGSALSADGVPVSNILRWDDGIWRTMGAGLEGGEVRSLALLHSGDLIAGGRFTKTGTMTVNRIARWDGVSWSALGSGLNKGPLDMVVLPDGRLVVTGEMTSAGGVPVKFLAAWDGNVWRDFGGGLGKYGGDSLAVRFNGELLVGGGFVDAGPTPHAYFARYRSCSCPADFNHDGFVNGNDYDDFAVLFDEANQAADFNGDGFVNGNDYDEFADHFDVGC